MPVEQMLPQRIQRGLDSMNGYRFVADGTNGIDQKRNKGDMIQVCMRDKNMINFDHFGQTQITHARSRIDQHIIVQQHRSGLFAAPYPSATPQDPEFQEISLSNALLHQQHGCLR